MLGLKRNASGADIKRAYHKIALKCHPDKTQGRGDLSESQRAAASERFKDASEAYDALLAAYAELKEHIDQLVGEINGRHGTTGRVPMQYFYRNFDQRSLFAHYRAADVAVVTPLRDGMNLVAHEYVISRQDEDGVLILSEFAGAAGHLPEALQVNPYDIDGIAQAM